MLPFSLISYAYCRWGFSRDLCSTRNCFSTRHSGVCLCVHCNKLGIRNGLMSAKETQMRNDNDNNNENEKNRLFFEIRCVDALRYAERAWKQRHTHTQKRRKKIKQINCVAHVYHFSARNQWPLNCISVWTIHGSAHPIWWMECGMEKP